MGAQHTGETPSTHLCPSLTHCADDLGTARVQGRPQSACLAGDRQEPHQQTTRRTCGASEGTSRLRWPRVTVEVRPQQPGVLGVTPK